MPDSKKILLFSTLNPYPFWAGSENLWYDFVRDNRVNSRFQFRIMLADSPVTRAKAKALEHPQLDTVFYKHFNVEFLRRNLSRVKDKITRKQVRTLPWYQEISRNKYDGVWFNVAALADLSELSYAVELCKKTQTPYWLILQHGYEDFFLTSTEEMERVIDVATGARRFIFIADRNRQSLERAIAQPLANAWRTVNAIPAARIREASALSGTYIPGTDQRARFFNLGRFAPMDKAQHLLLEAFTGQAWKQRNWQLNFIGVSGFGKQYLEKMIRYYGLPADRIIITAHTDKVLEEIAQQDLLLMPSLSEGTPFAMVESMACGRPAMGTPIGGIPELISDRKTGWLSRTVQIQDICTALEQVWTDRPSWQQTGEAARDWVAKHYNQEEAFAGLLNALQEDLA